MSEDSEGAQEVQPRTIEKAINTSEDREGAQVLQPRTIQKG